MTVAEDSANDEKIPSIVSSPTADGDVELGEIFIVREGVAVFEPQIICRLHADSQQMSKQHESEECGGY